MNAKTTKLLRSISRLANCNPFSPLRFKIEKEILGSKCEPLDAVAWNRNTRLGDAERSDEGDRPNVIQLKALATQAVDAIRKTPSASGPLVRADLRNDYWNTVMYLLLYRHITQVPAGVLSSPNKPNKKQRETIKQTWLAFWNEYQLMLDIDCGYPVAIQTAAHYFACLTQVHRAFFNIFDFILGESRPIAELRGKVWESIFTCDLHRYHESLFARMRDLSTLITGPSGTGKELIARAIGLSQYVPFDPKTQQFDFTPDREFLPLNLSALSPTLIESELFGHHQGAFTGAVANRTGWLETCSPHGAVFLDEIGELDLSLQVKLLRVVQERTYCRIGETKLRPFLGKIIAATNRDIPTEIAAGRFREDFYFRLCTDRIETPSLRAQLDDRPSDLSWLVTAIVKRQLKTLPNGLVDEITGWIQQKLGAEYPWSGNIRELEQCVSSYIIRRDYKPLFTSSTSKSNAAAPPYPAWLEQPTVGQMTADTLLRRYCTWLYAQHASYEKVSKILLLDRRTVKAKVIPELLKQFQRRV
jgi:transcriptional regulator with AAA-type ATPase domain